jgi:phage tail protein X
MESAFPPGENPAKREKTAHAKTVDEMSDRYEADREQLLQDTLAADPGLAASQRESEAEMAAANKTADQVADEVAADAEDGAASLEPMHAPQAEEEPTALPEELQGDPLAEYIVMSEGTPMMKLKVDGQERLIPLDKARASIQKDEAAEIRLQRASEWNQQLQQREARIQEAEAAWNARAAKAAEDPPPATSDAGDLGLKDRVREAVSSMFSGSEEEAVEKFSEVIEDVRRQARQPSAPQIDLDAVEQRSRAAARQELQVENYQRGVQEGWEDFKVEYSDIMGDENLFRYADSLTDAIQAEHSDWPPSKVMLESGKRTREWVASIRGPEVPKPPPDQDRQANKGRLVPMPPPQTGRPEPEEEERPQSPAEVVAEMRASRNQPT